MARFRPPAAFAAPLLSIARSTALACGALAGALITGATPAAAAPVTIEGQAILVDGKPFKIRGASGETRLVELKGLGANTLRSYGGEADRLLAEARAAGLKVILGFWLEHPRRGFDYGDRRQVEAQLARLREFVLRHKDDPALLMWGIGNEVEAELTDDSMVWPAIEEAARLVKSLDPDHPTMAVLAETGTDKVRKVSELASSIDVLGVNSYGEALPSLPARVRAQGWTGPLVITELGPRGQWDAPRTPWNAPIEPTSTEKAALLSRYIATVEKESAGEILFYWGQKQEVTPTWHSLLLPSGEWTQAAEAMAEAWGGTTPGGNRAPRLAALRLEPGQSWDRAATAHAVLEANDPDGDPLAVEWRILQESTELGVAGDPEPVPPDRSAALREPSAAGVRIDPLPPGKYRLFAIVRDGRGAAATANLPFQVR